MSHPGFRRGFSSWFGGFLLAFAVLRVVAGPARAAGEKAAGKQDSAAVTFFETRVRPVLAERCYKCHGPDKQKNGLRVDSLAALLKGGATGPAVRPGKPEESLLIGAVRHGELFQMPPRTKLPAREIADL